jgi:hypothetical protein
MRERADSEARGVIVKLTLTAMMATMFVTITFTGVTAQNARDANVRSADRHQAPIGHRQPRPQDLPPDVRQREGTVPATQRDFDQQLNICRGC